MQKIFVIIFGLLLLGGCSLVEQPRFAAVNQPVAPTNNQVAVATTTDLLFSAGKIQTLVPQQDGNKFVFSQQTVSGLQNTGELPYQQTPQIYFTVNQPAAADNFSPFGFLGVDFIVPGLSEKDRNKVYLQQLQELGVRQVEGGAQLSPIWGEINTLAKQFNWQKFDALVLRYQKQNLYYIPWISSANTIDYRRCHQVKLKTGELPPLVLPCDLVAYQNFVQKLVERYDRDGKDDLPGLRWAQRDWVVGNEPDLAKFWQDSPENFAKMFWAAYQGIKAADPTARVHLAGGAGFLSSLLPATEKLPADFVDETDTRQTGQDGFWWKFFVALQRQSDRPLDFVVDQHFFGQVGEYQKMQTLAAAWQKLLQNFGYSELKLWSTENGTFAGKVALRSNQTEGGQVMSQTETEQAEELVRRYVFGLSVGYQKIFWSCLRSDETQAGLFSHLGLVKKDGSKTVAFGALMQLASFLNGGQLNVKRLITPQENQFAFLVQRGTQQMYIFWLAPIIKDQKLDLLECDFNNDTVVDEIEKQRCLKK